MTHSTLTHIDEKGRALMVDISGKAETRRIAVAEGVVTLGPTAFGMLIDRTIPKGDVIAAARIAGIMAAKKVDELIPLCHPLPIESVEINFEYDESRYTVKISATVSVSGKTGVEMEALTAVSVAALTVYDMCKAVEKGIVIGPVRLEYKSGGKSGTWKRENKEKSGG